MLPSLTPRSPYKHAAARCLEYNANTFDVEENGERGVGSPDEEKTGAGQQAKAGEDIDVLPIITSGKDRTKTAR